MAGRVGRTGAAAAVALLLAGACSAGPSLRDERSTPPYADLLRRAATQPQCSVHVRAEDPGQAPLLVHLREVRAPGGRERPLLVLQPGVLSDHTTWRFLAPLLADRYDLLLVDPPGTGLSDKPRPQSLPADGYTPAWLGRHTLRAVGSWGRLRGEDRRLVLIGHSLGGTAILRALAEPSTHQALPRICSRVERLVLFAPADVAMERVSPIFRDIAQLTTFEANVGDALGLLDARVERSICDAVVDPRRDALCQEARRLTRTFACCGTRRSAQAMLRRFRPVDRWGRPRWRAIRAQQALHRGVRQPVLIVWGAQDRTLPPAQGRDQAALLPDARLEIVDGARHSVHQERAQVAADLVVRFLEDAR